MQDINVPVIFEDPWLIAFNKPSGIHSVMNPNSKEMSVAELLASKEPGFLEVATKAEDAGFVHRLDFETSGILLAAKTREVWMTTRANLLAESVYKSYLCCVEGVVDKEGVIEGYIGNPNRSANKVKVFKKEPRKKDRALPARTEYKPLLVDADKDITFVQAVIHCARRHQVRAHLSHIGHPLLGDELYGSSRHMREITGSDMPKFFLHAHVMKFVHPVTEELVTLKADIPQPFNDILKDVID